MMEPARWMMPLMACVVSSWRSSDASPTSPLMNVAAGGMHLGSGGEVVEDDDALAAIEQGERHVAADIPRATGDEHSHGSHEENRCSLQRMVGATGIEPVTPTMSR